MKFLLDTNTCIYAIKKYGDVSSSNRRTRSLTRRCGRSWNALSRDLTLVTNNEREFRRVPDLRIENWRR